MKLKTEDIKKILIDYSYISESDSIEMEKYVQENRVDFIDALYSNNLITKDLLGQALSEYYKVHYSDLNSFIPDKENVLLIPEDIARKYNVVVFKKTPEKIVIATDQPNSRNLKAEIQKIFGSNKIEITFSLPEDIQESFIHYRKPLDTRFQKIIAKTDSVAPEIFEEVVRDALAYRASDIHFEPQIKEVIVRFRVDGVLQVAGQIQKNYYENVINRIKILASMKIDEHFYIQDGAIRFEIDEKVVDLRISVVPTINGEKIVIRVLSSYIQGFSLTDIGLNEKQKRIILDAVKKPVGMIIIAGPTGSGKTTSLYSFLKNLNKPTENITTIEDPVEYRIPGLNQIQVNEKNHITFSNGLRSVVRQDPDIILVGEIRDNETAELAVNAALTGHLLLSTFHANDAATVIPRMLDMGVEPFLLSSTLEVIVSQRLVRKICDNCKVSQTITKKTDLDNCPPEVCHYFEDRFKKDGQVVLYKGAGCSVCNNIGYRGRTSIFEIIPITPKLKELILKKPSTSEIWKMAIEEGATSLFEHGLEKVKQGVTSLDELLRVAPPKQ